MEENNDIFVAGSDALVYLAYQCTKNIPQHLFGAIHLVRTYLRTNFSTPCLHCKHMYAFRVTVSAVGLFQKILLNTIAHMYWTIWRKCKFLQIKQDTIWQKHEKRWCKCVSTHEAWYPSPPVRICKHFGWPPPFP